MLPPLQGGDAMRVMERSAGDVAELRGRVRAETHATLRDHCRAVQLALEGKQAVEIAGILSRACRIVQDWPYATATAASTGSSPASGRAGRRSCRGIVRRNWWRALRPSRTSGPAPPFFSGREGLDRPLRRQGPGHLHGRGQDRAAGDDHRRLGQAGQPADGGATGAVRVSRPLRRRRAVDGRVGPLSAAFLAKQHR